MLRRAAKAITSRAASTLAGKVASVAPIPETTKTQPAATPQDQEDWPSLDVIYAEVKDRVALQIDQSQSLDSKANFVFGSASLVIAALAALRNAAKPAPGHSLGRWDLFGWHLDKMLMVNVVTASALATFVGVVFCSMMAYRVHDFLVTPAPLAGAQNLMRFWSAHRPDITKAMLTESRINRDLPTNQAVIDRKAMWTKFALYGLMVEGLLLFAVAVVQVTL